MILTWLVKFIVLPFMLLWLAVHTVYMLNCWDDGDYHD